MQVAQHQSSERVRGEPGEKRWERPTGDQMKINTDGAFHQWYGGWGFVIRDASGDVLRAGAACLEGVQMAAECGMGQIVIETDSTMLRQALSSNDYRLAVSGGLVYVLKQLISSCFSSCLCPPGL